MHPKKGSANSFKSKNVVFQVKEETRGKLKEIAHATLDVSQYVGRNVDGEPHSVDLDVSWASKPSSAFQAVLAKNPGQIRLSLDPVNSKLTAQTSSKADRRSAEVTHDESEEAIEPERAQAAPPPSNNPFASLSRKVGEDSDQTVSSRASTRAKKNSPRVPRLQQKTSNPTLSESGNPRLSSRASSSTAGGSLRGKDKKKFGADSTKKLREQLQKAENARTGLERKLQQANQKIKMMEKYIPKNDMKMLKREIASGVGNQFGTTDEDFKVKSTSVTGDDLLHTVQDVVRRKDTDQVTIYWLSWCANLHTIMIPEAGVGKPLSDTGIVKEEPPTEAATPHGRYVFSLERVVQALYGRVLECIHEEINTFVQRKANNFFDVEVEVSGLGLDLVSILDRYLVAMRGNELPRTVLNQFFCQVFYYINGSFFNAFLRNANLCEPAIAIQLKFYFSEMENWVQENRSVLFHWSNSFKKQLLPIMDFINLLLLGKSNISAVMLKTAAPYVSLKLVKFMLDSSTDADPVPRSVLKEISSAAGYDEHDRIMLDEVLFTDDLFLTCNDVSNPSNVSKIYQ